MVSTLTWASFALPGTLVNVGGEAVCMLCDNILCFTDLKTKAITYYKAESPQLGFSISAFTGHNRFALLAFAEVVLMPAVHIIQYPTFQKYAVFNTSKIITFVDIRFNEYDLLLALSGYPNYTICIWNIRTGHLLIQQDTMTETLQNSLLCSIHYAPQIVQYSKWNNSLHVWELCYTSTGVNLHEVSKISLSQDYSLSDSTSMCYSDDTNLYIVDNYGTVSMVEVAQCLLKPQWSIHDPHEIRTTFRLFSISNHKQGLIIRCDDIIYYLRKKQLKWICEWKVTKEAFPRGGIQKLMSNINGELYGSSEIGNLYIVEVVEDTVTFNVMNNYHENSLDFILLKGIKEECLILLTNTNYLMAVEMSRWFKFSQFQVPNACTIVGHNNNPYVMVGTTTGKLHFINYSNIREPIEVGTIETKIGHPLGNQLLIEHLAIFRTIYYEFYLVKADFTTGSFHEICPLVRIKENVSVCEYFLTESSHVVLFVNRDSPLLLPHANEVWSFQMIQNFKKVKRHEYALPFIYRDITGGNSMKNLIEFFAVRLGNNVIDILNLKTDTNELVLMHTIQTNHLSNITGIVGTRNILTWGVDGTYIHFRAHKKSQKMYIIGQILQIKYRPRVVKKVLDCFNTKYLVYLYSSGGIKVMKVAPTGIPLIENSYRITEPLAIDPHLTVTSKVEQMDTEVIVEHSAEELRTRDNLLKRVQDLEKEVTNLIDFDMSVTGKSQGIFRKFCLNHQWLKQLTAESNKLCEVERNSLEAAINDQSRIRDWYYKLILSTNSGISFKIRAIFSNFSLENYGMRKRIDNYSQLFDLYLFYEMQPLDKEDDEIAEDVDDNEEDEKEDQKHLALPKKRKYFIVQGSAFEHVMSDELALQDIYTVTGNQMCNQDAKLRILLTDRLREEFNKKFEDIRKIKFDLMDAILTTNSTLTTIYSNMNCMLRLLGRDQFKPPALSVPEWQKDEFVKSIMEVDDSEIKAINRRKKKAEVQAAKRGRLLLWAIEFWIKALVTMMDGVLEKLWEEEIKKDLPPPEFLSKKDVAEYTLEDQKALRKYEEECRILQEDRQKYLRILTENDAKINELKKTYILKLNENITEMMILKFKYDFAIKHVRLRNINTKLMHFKKLTWLARINILRAEIELTGEYIQKYVKLSEFWGKSVEDLRTKVDNLMLKEKSIERQFKSQFLNSIPQHLGPEMNKIFKRRPKTSTKLLHSILICKELSLRVNSKTKPKFPFPLPKDVDEYMDGLNALDDVAHMPVSLETKHWEQFIKIRRQKVEIELKIRAVNLQIADGTSDMNAYIKNLGNLRNSKMDSFRKINEAQEEYLKSVQDQSLELRLTMGQVELNVMGSLKKLENCVLMNVDDINDINALILKAGQMKLKAMHRVAFFRRQVIYKEWEHKVVSVNIEYLKYMLYVISKCKVSIEFLNILRNWDKVRAEKQRILTTIGLLERTIEEKLLSFRRQLIRLCEKIAKVRSQIEEMKRTNKKINRQIDAVKVSVAFSTTNRDFMVEDKKQREQNEKMEKIKKHSNLIETVRCDYVHILELKTLLELQRLRTYPTLGPNPDHCST